MKDIELKEDQNLGPYQGELFPKGDQIQFKGWIQFETRGEALGNNKYKPKATFKWKKTPSHTTIEYD